jgi:type I restriction enzyme S subunit
MAKRQQGKFPVIGSNGIVGYHDIAKFHGPGVMVGRSGSVGKSYYIDGSYWPLNTTLFVEDFHGNNPRFVEFFCRHFDFSSYAAGVSVPTLNRNLVHTAGVTVPTLPEQKRIAAVLLKIQRAIETQEKIIQSLRDLKKSIMQHLFTHGLRGEKTKMTEIGEIPESWELVTLRTCCQVKSSTIAFRDLETMDTRNEDDVAVHAIKVSDMNLPGNDRDIVRANIEIKLPEAVAKKKAVSPLSIVFPKRGAAIATNKKRLTKEWTLLDPNLIAAVPDDSIMPLYLYYWFLTFDLTSLQDLGPTPQLNKKNVDPVEFPVPRTKDEQEEVASILDTIDAKLRLHESNKSVLQDLFKTTLNNLMTSDIRVGDLDIDVKEVKP